MIPIEYSLNVELIKERLVDSWTVVIYVVPMMWLTIIVLVGVPILLFEYIIPYLKECEWGLPPDWDHSL